MIKFKNITVAIFTILLLVGSAIAQCPMCKAGVQSAGEGKPSYLVEGLNHGILYLFALPYSMILMIGVVIFVVYRKKKAAQAAQEND